jgi:hypothetical protein
MPSKPSSLFVAALAVTLVLTGCGGGKKSSNATTTTNAVAASPAVSPGGAGESSYGGVGAATAQPVPANLHCGAVAPVWANTRTHVYHVSSDPLYGRTMHGEYICPQTAASEGYHKAGSGSSKRHHRSGGSMMQAQPSPSPGSE